MFDLRGCRACLNQDCKLERISDATRRLYCTVTGLEFTPGDCYPSYFCVECSSQIKKILAFRRRCRRAFYVLKEIVAVRKTVTLSDLAAVDRKKTNLRSNVDYWKNSNIGFYSIVKNTEEDDATRLSDIRNFLKEFEPQNEVDIKPNIPANKYTPKVINNTYIAVDIKPARGKLTMNYEETYNEVQEVNEADDDNYNTVDDDAVWNEPADDNVPAEDVPDGIDLNDVFKDLPEEKGDDSDYSLPDLEPEPETQKKVKAYRGKKPKVKIDETKIMETKKEETKNEEPVETIDLEKEEKSNEPSGIRRDKAFKFSRILTDFEIQLLSFEEQVETYQLRKDSDPYKSAAFKCSICLKIFPGMPELLTHVELHSNKQKSLTREQKLNFYCVICKDMFPSQQDLTAHSACKHWYKYQCKNCDQVKYTLYDTANCHGAAQTPLAHNYTMEEMYKMSEMTPELRVPQEKLQKTCRFCGLTIKKREHMDGHELVHVDPPANINRKRLYQCDMCGIWFRRKTHIETHMHLHYQVFECHICGQVFNSWVSAHNHLKEHKKFKCKNCEETFQSEPDRRTHQLKRHIKKEAKYDCTLCGEPIFSLSNLYYHQLRHHGYISINDSTLGDPKFRCPICGVQFVDSSSLLNHQWQKQHIENQKLPWTILQGSSVRACACGKVFNNVEDYLAHRRTTIYNCKRFPTKCAYCDAILHNYHMSKRHYDNEHPNLPNDRPDTGLVMCEHCGKKIVKTTLSSHLKRHLQGDCMYTCYVCRAKIYTSRAYVSHILFNHTPKPYLCVLCPYRGKHRIECREHILKVHAPELPYQCDTCGRRFSHLDLLHHHAMKAHGINVKADRSMFLPAQEISGKIFVFPHMKIDGSLIDPSVIEDITLYKYDYLCKTNEIVDYKDYFVFNTGIEPTVFDPSVVKKHQSDKSKRQKRVRQNDEILLSGGTVVRKRRKHRRKEDNGIEKAKKSKVEVIDDSVFNAFGAQASKVEDNDMTELKELIIMEENLVHKTIAYDKNAFEGKKASKSKLGKKNKIENAVFKVKKEQTVKGHEMPELDLFSYKVMSSKNVYSSNNAKQKGHKIDNSPKVVVKNERNTGNVPTSLVMFDKTDEDIKCDDDMNNTQMEKIDNDNVQEITVKAGPSEATEECIELDMSALLNQNYQVISDEDGEQYVVINGVCYKMQVGD